MMNFLYISYFFPPLSGAEPRHNLSMIRLLNAKGFIPTIITSPEDISYSKDQSLKKLIPEGISINRISWPYKSNKYINKWREVLKIPENTFVFKGWKHFYEVAQTKSIEGKYQFIYSVHGIGAAHLAALRLKRESGLPWIAEFRDPWIHNVIMWNYMKDKSWRWWYKHNFKKTEKIQRKILENADLVVVESPMHGEFLVRDFGISEDKVVPYGMGYDGDYFTKTRDCLINFNRKPIIGFVGSIYYGYNNIVKNLIMALKKLDERGYCFTLVPVGGCSSLFSEYAEEIGLESSLPINRVNLLSALSLMKNMDFGVVFISEDYKTNINSKIWEYIKSGLSVLALVPEDGAMAKIVHKGECGYCLPYDVDGMVQILEKALKDYEDGKMKQASSEYTSQFTCERMVDKLAEKIENIIRSKNKP